MKRQKSEAGGVGVNVALIICVVLLIAAAVFGYWAYNQRQLYKNKTDQIVAEHVQQAKQQQAADLQKVFDEKYKQPLKTYKGPSDYGSLRIKYPKTWSGYVEQTSDGEVVLDGYFAPGVVPTTQANDSGSGQSSKFSLRFSVVNQQYSDVMRQYEPYVQQGQSSVKPYHLPKVKSIIGSMVTGQMVTLSDYTNSNGVMVVLPLRAYTLEIWVTSPQYKKDFSKYILPNFSFSP